MKKPTHIKPMGLAAGILEKSPEEVKKFNTYNDKVYEKAIQAIAGDAQSSVWLFKEIQKYLNIDILRNPFNREIPQELATYLDLCIKNIDDCKTDLNQAFYMKLKRGRPRKADVHNAKIAATVYKHFQGSGEYEAATCLAADELPYSKGHIGNIYSEYKKQFGLKAISNTYQYLEQNKRR